MSPFALKDQYKMGAITWWYMYDQPYQHLQGLANKILSQVASSSAAKRNCSTYSYIHSVKRNLLGSTKAKDLVFIHTNLHLLSRNENEYKEALTKLWDVAHECANLDAMLHDLTTIINDGDDTMTHGASSTNGTVLGSNDLELAAIGDDENLMILNMISES